MTVHRLHAGTAFLSCLALMVLADSAVSQQTASPQRKSPADLVIQRGHSNILSDIVISPDSRLLVSCGQDEYVVVWDMTSGKILRTFRCKAGAVDISRDGRFLAAGTYEPNTVTIFDLTTGKIFATLTGHAGAVGKIAFHPDGRRLVSIDNQMNICVWEYQSGRLLATLTGHQYDIKDLAVSPDGKFLYTGGGKRAPIFVQEWGKPKQEAPKSNHELRQWSLDTYTLKKELTGHDDMITGLAISPDGNVLAAGQDNGKVLYFNMMIGLPLGTWKNEYRRGILDLKFSKDGSRLTVATWADKVFHLDGKSGKLVGETAVKKGVLTVEGITISPDGNTLATYYGYNFIVDLWKFPSGSFLRSLSGGVSALPGKISTESGGRFAAGEFGDGSAKVIDLTLGKIHASFFRSDPNEKDAPGYNAVALSRDGQLLAAGYSGQFQKFNGIGFDLWDVRRQQKLLTHRAHGRSGLDNTNALAFSPDGKTIAVGIRTIADQNSPIEIFRVSDGTMLKSLPGHFKSTYDLAFSPDGRILLSAGKGELKAWGAESGSLLKEMVITKGQEDYCYSIDWSPDGSKIVASGLSITESSEISWLKVFNVGNWTTILDVPTGKQYYAHVSFSPDGRFLVAAPNHFSQAYAIDVFDLGGKKVKSFSGHSFGIVSTAFTPDGRNLISSSNDGTIQLWDYASASTIATMVATGQQGCVMTTSENYYLASKDAYPAVGFRLDNRIFPFEQFDLMFNRPDIVLGAVGRSDPEIIAAYKQAYLKRLAKMGFTENMIGQEFHLPEISIKNTNLPLTTQDKTLQLAVSARDSKYSLDRINVHVNDVPIFGSAGINLRPLKVSSIDREIKLELSSGRNKIQVSTLNQQGVESLKETVEIIFDGTAPKPDLYVLAVGVSDYVDDAFDLTYAAKDASDLASTLKNTSSYGRVVTKTILDKNATKANILACREFLMQSGVDDHVIVFVAGHGLLDDKLDYYLATTDVDFDNPSIKGLPYEDLEGLVDGIPARKKLILMDACHSGEVDKEETELIASAQSSESVKSRGFKKAQKKNSMGLKNSFELMKELFADLRRGSGAMVISSASGVEFAFESPEWKNGVFTYSLLNGLRSQSADRNKDGQVIVSELRDYVIESVKTLTNGKQTPTSRQENLEFDFRVY